jgi:DNA primase
LSSRSEYLAQASAAYHEQMRDQRDHVGVKAYLTDHDIYEWPIVAKYRLGYVADPLPGDDMFVGRLVIPYIRRDGVVSIKFRRIGDEGAKYLYHPGQKHRLYNPEAAHVAQHSIGITEGEVDAIVATERLGLPTVGVPGSKGWAQNSGIWTPIFKDFKRVIVFADGDDAGYDFASEVAESIGQRARIAKCDQAMDVASQVATGDVDRLKYLIRE